MNSELLTLANVLILALAGWCLIDYARSVFTVARGWHEDSARRLRYWSHVAPRDQWTRTHAGVN